METLYFLLFLVCVDPLYGRPRGRLSGADSWIAKRFCTVNGQYTSLPWDCSGFVHCEGVNSHWLNCPPGLIFDGQTCSQDSSKCTPPESAAATYCPEYPFLKFAHPKSCAMYYDCSQTSTISQYGFKKYENECKYPALFDHITMECRNQDSENPVYCENKPAQCDYARECGTSGRVGDECSGLVDGDHADPLRIFLPNYIKCSGGKVSGRFMCGELQVFNPLSRICTAKYKNSIDIYCLQNPTATFADAHLCSMYYDCSVMNHHTVLNNYQTECKYRHLYDLGTKSCQRFNKLTIPCESRKEPKSPSDYRVSDCDRQGRCIPNSASCIGLPDGPNPYPKLEDTGYRIHCESERTLGDFEKCRLQEIFLPGEKDCGLKVVTETTTTTTKSPPTTTKSQPTNTESPPTTTESPSPTTTPDTSNRVDCNVPPVCAAELGALKDNITKLFGQTESLTEKVNEKLPDPFECVTPPTSKNSRLRFSYTSTAAKATLTCDEGFTICGGDHESTCMTNNQWTSPVGHCVQYLWTKFDDPAQKIIYKCPLPSPSTLTISGRYIGTGFRFSLSDVGGPPDKAVIFLQESTEQEINFGNENAGLTKGQIGKSLINSHVWKIDFEPDRFRLSLNGEDIGDAGHELNFVTEVQLEINGGFIPDRIQFHPDGIPFSMDVEYLDINLAYKKMAEGSSNYDGGASSGKRITDGENLVNWEDTSCWASADLDMSPTIAVDLGQNFFVSHVVVTTPNCTIDTCGILNEITVHITPTNEKALLTDAYVCAYVGSQLPKSHVTKIKCEKPLIGQFVTITRKTPSAGKLAICELEVYGGRAKDKAWTPYGCPQPPLVMDATVKITHTTDAAIATYTCNDKYSICSGNNVIHCYGPRGWEKTPEPCVKTTIEAELGESISKADICPLRSRSGIELWMTPQQDNAYMKLIDTEASKVFFSMTLQLNDQDPITFQNDVKISNAQFTKTKESHVFILVFIDYVLVEVDGVQIYAGPSDINQAMAVDSLEADAGFSIRKIKIHHEIGVKQKWTPFYCPEPVLRQNADVVVSKSRHLATATYTCKDGFSFCTGSDTVVCKGPSGWENEPPVCEQSTFTFKEEAATEISLPCTFRLGQAIEITFTPTSDSDAKRPTVMLKELGSLNEALTIEIKPSARLMTLTSSKGVDIVPTNVFTVDKESRIVVTFLTENLDIAVDGIYHAEVPFPVVPGHVSTSNGLLRRVRIIPAVETVGIKSDREKSLACSHGIVPMLCEGKYYGSRGCLQRQFSCSVDKLTTMLGRSLGNNLAQFHQSVRASTSETDTDPLSAVDGKLDRTSKSCWVAAAADTDPFFEIQLKNYYYFERLIVSTMTCTGECAERTHDVEIRVYYDSREAMGEIPQICAYREGVIPATSDETITCERDVHGRYVRLYGLKRRNSEDKLTFCEVRIFGTEIIRNPGTLHGTDPCPTADGYLSVESPRLCFKPSAKTDAIKYTSGDVMCGDGARLINIDTADKYNYIMNFLTNMGSDAFDNAGTVFRMWVGLKANSAGNFEWSGGSRYIHKWDSGQPDNGASVVQECVEILTGGFSDNECLEERRYICEIPIPIS